MIKGIQEAVTIPVMAKARIGHFAEAQVLEALEVDYIDESEVLTPADEANHIDKWGFKVPFVCGATNLGEALRRIGEGAAMIRSKGEAGTGDIVEAVRHLRAIRARDPPPADARRHGARDRRQGAAVAAGPRAPGRGRDGKLPVVLFCAGGIATPADASLVMQLGAEGVFVGSGIFKSEDPAAARGGDRRGDDALPGPGARRARLRGPRHGDAVARDAQARRGPAARQPRLVVGVLALQGDFEAHSKMLRGLGAEVARGPRARRPRGARRAGDARRRVDDDDARHQARGARGPAARRSCATGKPVLGTCAGMIMLDREHLGCMDTLCVRNAFGRQIRSFEEDLDIPGIDGAPVRAVFIRAPWLAEYGDAVEILAEVDGHPVAARQDNMLVISFHPEIAGETRVHELFLQGRQQ